MHSEHISNLHPGWVVGGWLVAVSVAGVVFLVLVGTGILPGGEQNELGGAAAVAVGFFVGGLFVGLRWSNAPILNGAAITFLSSLVWFGSALVPGPLAGRTGGGATAFVLGMVLLQLVASVTGGLAGRSVVRHGRIPDPAAFPPEA